MTPRRNIHELLGACRHRPVSGRIERGLWSVETRAASRLESGFLLLDKFGRRSYTLLRRWTLASMHQEGEVVMDDSPREVLRHIPLLRVAAGRVLVSGLGLGCVLRGLLALPEVEHVDVLEIDPDVIALVGPEFADEPRTTIHRADALEWEPPAGTRWDFAWHDIWCEGTGLQLLHSKLLMRFRRLCGAQGAWAFPREFKRLWRARGPESLLG